MGRSRGRTYLRDCHDLWGPPLLLGMMRMALGPVLGIRAEDALDCSVSGIPVARPDPDRALLPWLWRRSHVSAMVSCTPEYIRGLPDHRNSMQGLT